jgi:hypothetical protein
MPRPRGSTKTPAYCQHKPSGRAYVNIGGRVVYLGLHGTPESHAAYDRVVGEWLVAGRAKPVSPVTGPSPNGLTVSALIAAFWEHAKVAYPAPPCAEGRRPQGELGTFATCSVHCGAFMGRHRLISVHERCARCAKSSCA